MAVQELKVGILAANFLPKTRYSESLLSHVCIVQQDNSAGRELYFPRVEVVGDGIIGMKPVNVKQINTVVGKVRKRLIKRRTHKA